MDVAAEASLINRSAFFAASKRSLIVVCNHQISIAAKKFPTNLRYASRISDQLRRSIAGEDSGSDAVEDSVKSVNLGFLDVLVKRGIVLAAIVCGVLAFGCRRAFAVEGVMNAGYGVIEQSILLLKSSWPKVSQVLRLFKEQGLILAALLGLSAFFSMAETSITTLWPWKGLKSEMWNQSEGTLPPIAACFSAAGESGPERKENASIAAGIGCLRYRPTASARSNANSTDVSETESLGYEFESGNGTRFDTWKVVSQRSANKSLRVFVFALKQREAFRPDQVKAGARGWSTTKSLEARSAKAYGSLRREVRELAEKESENGVFKMLRSDVTRFLTTILIGTTVVNIGATALVTEAATSLFGEAGV
ncbi:CBS domain-containing protein [Actinidia rufa]|uniref:CBS domain-containing protein n=1 Tax=Actinidia rufa TaxID=165716 RepID=A0A7J0HGG1_9ERIC|nr:CBS domain-containing protein [Actinidia rufa]